MKNETNRNFFESLGFGLFLKRVFLSLIVVSLLGIIGSGIWFFWGLHFVEKHEYAFTYDQFSGKIEPVGRSGWLWMNPIKYAVHSIDCRPYQLSITASYGSQLNSVSGVPSRVLNAKLVKFDPKGIGTFIEWHGRHAGDKLDNLREVMKCYAFDSASGADCPFIKVLSEINPSQTPAQTQAVAKPNEGR